VPAAIGRVRKLIHYGKQLAGTAQPRAAALGFALFAKPFGAADLAVILARTANGLCRAAALEAAQPARRPRPRPHAVPHPRARRPRARRRPAVNTAGPAGPRPANPTGDPRLARLPTEKEIAAEVRRRPIGAVIVDICCDLGITPGQLDRAFWDELSHAIIAYGGSLAGFLDNLHRRVSAFVAGDPPTARTPYGPRHRHDCRHRSSLNAAGGGLKQDTTQKTQMRWRRTDAPSAGNSDCQ
jgi:hypothetical protein